MSTYYDYTFKFLITDLPHALSAFVAIRALNLLAANKLPNNMLGDARDTQGNPVKVTSNQFAFAGSRGRVGYTYTNPLSGEVIVAPAIGDPAYFYINIRSLVDMSQYPFVPGDFGLIVSTQQESDAVLGVWA